MGGCAGMHPPELDAFGDDPDGAECTSGSAASAIAACERVLGRPDVHRWRGSYVALLVYETRAHLAWHLARHLAAADRDSESLAAAVRSIELFERYDRERDKTANSPQQRSALDRQTNLLNVYLARAHYAAGRQLVRLHRWPEAARHLHRTVELDERSAVAWATLGVAANQSGDHATSTRAFERALAMDPEYFSEQRSIQRSVYEAAREGRTFDLGAHPSEQRR